MTCKRALLCLGVLMLLISCAHVSRDPHDSPAPRGISAHLDAFPPVTIAGHAVTLIAWLDDPEAQVRCPSVEWLWEDGTRSAHASDCDPDEQVTRHQEVRRGVLGSGEHKFTVTFSSAGRSWRAERTVPVA